MTELDEVLADIGTAAFDGAYLFRYEAQGVQSPAVFGVKIAELIPQTNGLMVKMYGTYNGQTRCLCGALLRPGQERLKLLRELAGAWEELRVRERVPIVISLSKPNSNRFKKANRLRKGEVTQPVSPSIEAFVSKVLDGEVDASQLVYDRSMRLIRQTFQQIQASISLEEVSRVYNEVMVERIHKA